MPLEDLIYSMINRKGLTLKLELRNYMKISHPGTEISKPGYLKQRMKLNPGAIKYLYQYHNKNFYSDPEITPYLYKGHLALAADGSDINIPTTPENLEIFGTASRKETKPQAQIGLGCLYDVLNRFVIDSDINRVKFDEMALAEKQIDRLPETIGDRYPFFVIMDRGYPSIPAFMSLFDVYEGEKIPEGKKQYAMSFVLMSTTTTLTDKVIEKTMSKIQGALEQQLNAVLR